MVWGSTVAGSEKKKRGSDRWSRGSWVKGVALVCVYIYIHSMLITSDTLLFITYFLPTVTGHLILQPTRSEEKTKPQKGGGTQKNLRPVSSSLVLALQRIHFWGKFLEIVVVIINSGQQACPILGVVAGVVGDVVAFQGGHLAVHGLEDGVASTDVPLLDEGDVDVGLHIALDHLQRLVACRYSGSNNYSFFLSVNGFFSLPLMLRCYRVWAELLELMECKSFLLFGLNFLICFLSGY